MFLAPRRHDARCPRRRGRPTLGDAWSAAWSLVHSSGGDVPWDDVGRPADAPGNHPVRVRRSPCDNCAMAPVLTRLYRRLGRCYPYVFLTVELQSAFVITAATLGLFSFYYDASTGDYLKILAVSLVLTAVAVWITLLRTFPSCARSRSGSAAPATRSDTREAWAAAVGLPLALIRRDVCGPDRGRDRPGVHLGRDRPRPSAGWPSSRCSRARWSPLGYSAILHYLVLETGMRPVLLDIKRVRRGAAAERPRSRRSRCGCA